MKEHSNAVSRRTFIGSAAIGLSALLYQPTLAFAAPTAAEKQAEAQNALVQLTALRNEADAAAANYFAALDEQQQAQDNMDACQERINEANESISNLQTQLGNRARSMYTSGSLSFLDLLLGATSFQAFTNNWDLLNTMNEKDAEMVQQTKDLRAEIEAQKEEYSNQEKIAADKAAEAERIKAQADAAEAAQQEIYDSLSAEAAELLRQEEAAREEAQRRAAEEEQRRMAAEAAAQQQRPSSGGNGTSNGGSGSGSSTGGGSSTPSYSGDSKPQTVTGNVVVDRAYSQIGKPYAWGAVGPNSFDCSGLVSYALSGSFSRIGTTYTFMGWPRVSNPQPGDVCTSSTHCGIYIGGGQMIHAPHTGATVCVSSVHSGMIYVRY